MARCVAVVVVAVWVLVLVGAARGGESSAGQPSAVEAGALARLPVREVTVFKDGHAFVLHEGKLPTDSAGNVVMDYLPSPVLGTFWPYVADPETKLASVTAGVRRVAIKRTALTVREMIEANIGADVIITETGTKYPANIGSSVLFTEGGAKYPATIVGIPTRSAEELAATSPPNTAEMLPQKGGIVLLKIDEGVKAVPIDRIQDVIFRKAPATGVPNEEFRNLLTLRLDWGKGKPQATAPVGLLYVQKGIRWIPNYKIDLNGKGKAVVKLQATLLNELTDIEGVTVNLVIGVPTFAFKETVDPMALQQAMAQLSQYFQESPQTAYAMSNAIMSQSARMSEYRRPAAPQPAGPNLGPEAPEGAKNEDLFVFTVKNVSLRKGERLVLPVAEYTLDYKDVYVLDIPFAPPLEMRRSFNTQQQAELARLFNAPKAMHKARLINQSKYPLTTAPALILREGRVLGQGMMTYTAIGASTDLDITAAVDVQVKVFERETGRVPNVEKWNNTTYGRIELAGTLSLTNHLAQAIDLEVTRQLLGNIDTADNDGVKQKASMVDPDNRFAYGEYPYWWSWYSWPYWWSHFNGISRATWKCTIEPGKSIDLGYTWHYFWPW